MKKSELLVKVKSLELPDTESRNAVVCALIGHSKIVDLFFGYVSCGRCNAQIGDTLGGVFDLSNHVVVGHKCEKCVENYKKLTWQDKLFAKDPFKDADE